jgi:glutathione S-transferase
MKLRYSPTSPYVRKVSVTAIEKGVDARIERIPTNVWDAATDIGDDNPLGKVPALITDDLGVLYDSPVICEYLDSLTPAPRLFPATGPLRWQALRQQALADGLLDAGVGCLLEGRRPESERSRDWIARQSTTARRVLDAMEAGVASLTPEITIGHIATVCALGWLLFRQPIEDWRPNRSRLAGWYEQFLARPSMRETMPHEP